MIRLNIGCGKELLAGWINCDLVPADGVIAADACDMPFPDGFADEIRSSHMIEHLSRPQAVEFAGECLRLLRSGGTVEIIAPSLKCAIKHYYRKRYKRQIQGLSPIRWIDHITSGEHRHPHDFHRQGIYEENLLEYFARFTNHEFRYRSLPHSPFEIVMIARKP